MISWSVYLLRLKWKWVGHIARMSGNCWTKRTFECRPKADKRTKVRFLETREGNYQEKDL